MLFCVYVFLFPVSFHFTLSFLTIENGTSTTSCADSNARQYKFCITDLAIETVLLEYAVIDIRCGISIKKQWSGLICVLAYVPVRAGQVLYIQHYSPDTALKTLVIKAFFASYFLLIFTAF
jgi:hypothetical protein